MYYWGRGKDGMIPGVLSTYFNVRYDSVGYDCNLPDVNSIPRLRNQ